MHVKNIYRFYRTHFREKWFNFHKVYKEAWSDWVFDPRLGRQRQGDFSEFQACLIYIAKSRPVGTVQWNPVPKPNPTQTKLTHLLSTWTNKQANQQTPHQIKTKECRSEWNQERRCLGCLSWHSPDWNVKHTWSYVQSRGTVKSLLRGSALEEMKWNSMLLPKVLHLLSCRRQWGQEGEARLELPASWTDPCYSIE